jgi:capsular polysaccharide transport system permease protein
MMRAPAQVPETSPSVARLVPRARLPAEPANSPGRPAGTLSGLPALLLPPLRPRRLSLRALSFILIVVLPTALAADYLFAVAADQYVAEFRFTLSTVDAPRLDPLALLGGMSVQSPAALESQVLVQYIGSRAIVDDLDRSLDLRRIFAAPQADWPSRLAQRAAMEELVRYWRGQVDPFYDPTTATVTVRVRAFAPDDALRLAQGISAACERLVNALSLRARGDALQSAESELAQAESRLAAVRADIRAFRERSGLIDPGKTADADSVLANRLQEEVVAASAQLATLQAYMRSDAPTVRVLQARIRALERQRRLLAERLTGPDGAAAAAGGLGAPLSGVLNGYEQLQDRQKFAEAAYQSALRGVDAARAEADRQHVFLASFVPPSLPEEAGYPRRWRSLGIVALMAFALWAIGGLAAQSVRDHLA